MGFSLDAIRKGVAAEYLAKAYFAKNGYSISTPDTHEKHYDFLVEKDNLWQRVQVKAAVYHSSLIRFRNKRGGANTLYAVEDYDILAGVHVERNYIYLFNSWEINGVNAKEAITVGRIDGVPMLSRKRFAPYFEGSV